MLGYSISGQITQLSPPPSQHQTQQQYATQQQQQQQQSHNHLSKLIKLPSYIKLDFVRAVNMQELLASRTSSRYYLRFILNECEKYTTTRKIWSSHKFLLPLRSLSSSTSTSSLSLKAKKIFNPKKES